MLISLKSKRLRAGGLLAVLTFVLVLGSKSFSEPAEATHGGMDTMSIDMDTSGNSAASVGALQQCARINRNGFMDADEDVTDGVIIDVTAENVPAYDNHGTGNTSDDTGGIVGYQYTFNYPPAQFTINNQEATTPAVNILAASASSAVSSMSDTLPDDNATTTWDSYAIDSANPSTSAPESGSGVLDRLTVFAEAGATNGQYLLSLSANVHVDASGEAFFPHVTNVANIAVGQACSTMITSLGYYHPVTPARILDTRTGPGPIGAVGAGGEITVDVTGVGGVPANPWDVSAVVVNATVTGATAPSFLTVYPSGVNKPNSSNLNFVAGQTVPNLVTVKTGADGNVKVFNAAGQTHVIFDVVGWYGLPTGGSRFNALAPTRILDTRTGTGAPAAKIGAGGTITVDVTNTFGSGVPASGVSAVVVNATVTGATAPSFLTVYPSDAARPTASNLNFVGGQTVPNLVIVKVGQADGSVKVYNAAGQTQVIFDVVGWYDSASGNVFNPVTPSRVLDTRVGPPMPPPGKVQNNAQMAVDVTGIGNVPPTGASGVIVNATVTDPTANSFLTVFPSDVGSPPTASNLNFSTGQTVPNLVIVKIGIDGNVKVYNAVGQVHVLFDAVGFFAPAP